MTRGSRSSTRSELVLARLAQLDDYVQRAAVRGHKPDAEHRAFGPPVTEPFAKFPAEDFDYLAELARLGEAEPTGEADLLEEVARFFRGAQRPQSPYCLFNLNVLPTIDATAAACLSVIHNVNGLMDAFAGESLLVEQKVARTIGRWAGWPEAMGISCNGGKVTMQYALRSAIARAAPASRREGISCRFVVFCSAGAHYSVEHVATSIGMGADNCVRIPVDAGAAMSSSALWSAMERAHEDGAVIAAVVCSGGTIIDFCCDNTSEIADLVQRFAEVHDLDRPPYLHFDGVIGWLYLALRGASAAELERVVPDAPGRSRIAEVLRRCEALERFDSLGVDFHKTGLCPYASSFFIARDRQFMDDLGTGDYEYSDADLHFGNFRTYRYTIENTRPIHGILAAWVNLLALGRSGYAAYLASLHCGRAQLESAIERHGRFWLLNPTSLGWELVIEIPFAGVGPDSYADAAVAFMEHCWNRVRDGHELPLFSIVPEFHQGHDPARSRCAFVLYPMGERPAEHWDAVVSAIALELDRFERLDPAGRLARPAGWEKPIR